MEEFIVNAPLAGKASGPDVKEKGGGGAAAVPLLKPALAAATVAVGNRAQWVAPRGFIIEGDLQPPFWFVRIIVLKSLLDFKLPCWNPCCRGHGRARHAHARCARRLAPARLRHHVHVAAGQGPVAAPAGGRRRYVYAPPSPDPKPMPRGLGAPLVWGISVPSFTASLTAL